MFFITTQTLDRKEAIRRINLIVGKDLRAMADEYKIAVWRNSRENKGWAGQVIERYLGLPQNSRQAPDFGDWELKVVPLRKDASGNLRVKESMAITMLEPAEVVANNFEDSHLYDKLRSMVVVSRIWESKEEARSMLHAAAEPKEPRRVFVAPGTPNPRTQRALKKLGIEVLSYKWDGNHPIFLNLRGLVGKKNK